MKDKIKGVPSQQVPGPKITGNKRLGLSDLTPELLARLREGDHEAFNTVYLLGIEPMLKFLCLLLHSESEAEELAQHVFVYIWEHREHINPYGNFKSYLYRVTKSEALKKLSRSKVERKYIDFIQNSPFVSSPGPDEIVASEELALMIKISLETMPEKQKRVFEMSRFEGLSGEEIARKLNISHSTVRVHLHLASAKLKDLISVFILLFIS